MSKLLDHVQSSQRISDLERILVLAEEMQEKCLRYSQRIELYRGLEFVFIGGGTTVAIWLSLRGTISFSNNLPFLAIAIIPLIYAAVLEYLVGKMKRRTLPDRIALADLVELLRETESALGEAENWSTLDRAQFRIRLSRFGIGREGWHT